MIKSLPPWKRSFQKYLPNLSAKISLLKIAPDLLKSQSHVYSPKILRIICVMALFLNDSVHYLIPWRVRKVNPVWIYVQIANATTQGYLSPNNAWKKTQHNVPRKGQNCFLPLPHHCVGKNIPLAHPISVQFWNACNACMEICARVSICICFHCSHWNLFTPFPTDWQCSATPLILIPMLMLILN